MTTRLYQLRFDASDRGQWFLDNPVDASSGRQLRWVGHFGLGEPLDVRELSIPLLKPGHPLDVTLHDFEFVVSERIGKLIADLAPEDVQRISARIESVQERYEALNLLSTIDCIDWQRTRAQMRRPGEERVETGSLASFASLLEHEPDMNLYRYVMSDGMRLNPDGIEGARLFRVKNWTLWPVVTEEIKVALEHEGATGLEYRLLP